MGQDNYRVTWSAYNNHYWPTLYLIDKTGHIRYVHIGEGRYAETETAIESLLAETYPYSCRPIPGEAVHTPREIKAPRQVSRGA